VNPNQILMAVRKILDQKELISENATVNYRDAFSQIRDQMERCGSAGDWMALYRKLVYWELELDETDHPLKELLVAQKREANHAFGKFIRRNYERWMIDPADRPLISPALFERFLFPMLNNGEKLFFILIDNFRLDQWLAVKDVISEYFSCHEELYCSILPTATPYARNATF